MKAGMRAFKESKGRRWQQFVVHALDERGDGINDFYVEIGTVTNGKFQGFSEFELDVHIFKDNHSFRCFHVDLDALGKQASADLRMRVVAESGTELVAYIGYQGEGIPLGQVRATESIFDAAVELHRRSISRRCRSSIRLRPRCSRCTWTASRCRPKGSIGCSSLSAEGRGSRPGDTVANRRRSESARRREW